MISVIVPTKNREDKLRRLLDSLEQQNYDKNNFEVVIVNDGSHYNSMTSNEFSINVSYFEIDGIGPAGARNFGVKNSVGDIIAFIDDDCVAPKTWLTGMDVFFSRDSNKDILAVGGGVKPLVHNKKSVNNYLSFIKFLDGPLENNGKITNMATANLAVRRSAFYTVGGFENKMRYGEDENLVWKLSQNGNLAFCYTNDVMHDNDISFGQFYRKYIGYGSGVRMHCKLSGEKLQESSGYFLYCSSKKDLIKNMKTIIARGKKRVRENEDYKKISLLNKIVFLLLSITQEYCVQKGGII